MEDTCWKPVPPVARVTEIITLIFKGFFFIQCVIGGDLIILFQMLFFVGFIRFVVNCLAINDGLNAPINFSVNEANFINKINFFVFFKLENKKEMNKKYRFYCYLYITNTEVMEQAFYIQTDFLPVTLAFGNISKNMT
jgi:hypothetical protein